MRKKPVVSVIIPTYNRAAWLRKSIESVLNQTYQNFELIVVDDGSTDETLEVVKSFKDKRIRYFRQTKKFPIKSQGAAAARNIGIKNARGEFIAFNDDDDLWRKRKLEKQMAAFKNAGKKTGVVYSKIVRIKGKEKFFIPKGKDIKKEGNVYRDLFLENWTVALPSSVVKKECFQKAGLFDEEFPRYQEWELWLRMSKDYDFKYLSDVLVKSYILEKGIHTNDKALLRAIELILKKHKKEIEKDNLILAFWCFRLGDFYYHKGRMEKARKLFKKAYSLYPSFRYFRAVIKTILGKRISETLIRWQIGQVKNWPLFAVLALALILRLINLNQSLWLDEAVQAITSQGSFLNIFQELRGDFHPPLYHLLMWGWVHLFGSKEIILRLPSVLFGVATVFVVYLITKLGLHSRSVRLRLVAALFLATAPFHIYYSQEARNYALATLLASLSMYYFIKNQQRKGLALGYLLLTTFLLYTNYFGLFILLAQALVIAIRREWRRLRMVFYCLLLFLPNLVLLRTQLLTGYQATTSLPEWGRLVNVDFLKALPLTFIKFSIGRITVFNKKIYALITGILFIIYGGIITRGLANKKRPLILFSWLSVPILCAWLISFFIPNYQPFRLLLVLPALYLLLAWGIFQIRTTILRNIVVIFVILINLISTSAYFINPYFHREDWRGLVQYIERQPKEDKVAILPSHTSYWPYEYYSIGKVRLVSISSGVKTITQENINNLTIEQFDNKTIYYIRYLVPMFDPQEKAISWLNENGFVKIKEVSFNQIPLWIYEPL